MIKVLLTLAGFAATQALLLDPPKVLSSERPPIKIPPNFKTEWTAWDNKNNSLKFDANFTFYVDSNNNRVAQFFNFRDQDGTGT